MPGSLSGQPVVKCGATLGLGTFCGTNKLGTSLNSIRGGITIVAANGSNSGVDGYSRLCTNFENSRPRGVVAHVVRMMNDSVRDGVIDASSKLEYSKSLVEEFSYLERNWTVRDRSVPGDVPQDEADLASLEGSFRKLKILVSELNLHPDEQGKKVELREHTKIFIDKLKINHELLITAKAEAQKNIKNFTEEANEILGQISKLSRDISSGTATFALEDKRDKLFERLAELMPIDVVSSTTVVNGCNVVTCEVFLKKIGDWGTMPGQHKLVSADGKTAKFGYNDVSFPLGSRDGLQLLDTGGNPIPPTGYSVGHDFGSTLSGKIPALFNFLNGEGSNASQYTPDFLRGRGISYYEGEFQNLTDTVFGCFSYSGTNLLSRDTAGQLCIDSIAWDIDQPSGERIKSIFEDFSDDAIMKLDGVNNSLESFMYNLNLNLGKDVNLHKSNSVQLGEVYKRSLDDRDSVAGVNLNEESNIYAKLESIYRFTDGCLRALYEIIKLTASLVNAV